MIFRKKYTVRRYGPQKTVGGYATQSYTDMTAQLNIQPDNESVDATAEGVRTVGRIKVFGSFPFTAADQFAGVKGDCVSWRGQWYECTKSAAWDGTPLAHFCSFFTAVADTEEGDV